MGVLLRAWRRRKSLSQQGLAEAAAVSARHVSRVETGLAHPTPEMILRLAEHLDVPQPERDRLLLAGGYAPRSPVAPEAADPAVLAGVRDLLDAHLPHPALLLDDHWDLIDANAAAAELMAGCAPHLLEPPVNVLRLTTHPDGLARRVRNLPQWAGHLREQLRHRAERTGDAAQVALLAEITGHLAALGVPPAPEAGPVQVLELESGDGVLRFVSTSTRLTGTADRAVAGLRLETLLPADGRTRALFARVGLGGEGLGREGLGG
ncbi:transcriptional regulator [Actinosynnema pretiosum]|uniref:Transcriptional regulator n=1 Tax=Actinosynnema pretiosum TaxID=42197 RepID=A0A290ZH61_9PSEU|nr:transcriptional regulator [Actinosynnema pretiosum]